MHSAPWGGTLGRLKPTLGRVPRVGSNLGEVPWVGTRGPGKWVLGVRLTSNIAQKHFLYIRNAHVKLQLSTTTAIVATSRLKMGSFFQVDLKRQYYNENRYI